MTAPSYEQILVEDRGRTRILTLNRPDKLNAWTRQMNFELVSAIEAANADPELAAIVVTGAGRGFCAGADIGAQFKARLDGGEAGAEADRRPPRPWVELVRDSKPMIAAINGVAVGVGVTLTLPFDVIVLSERARVGMFFVRMGLVPELCSSHFLVQRVGWAKASEMCLTGALYDAAELGAMGFANAVVPHEQTLDRAVELAARIGENADSSLRAIKRLLTKNGSSHDLDEVHRREMEELNAAYASDAHREAVAAFMAKP